MFVGTQALALQKRGCHTLEAGRSPDQSVRCVTEYRQRQLPAAHTLAPPAALDCARARTSLQSVAPLTTNVTYTLRRRASAKKASLSDSCEQLRGQGYACYSERQACLMGRRTAARLGRDPPCVPPRPARRRHRSGYVLSESSEALGRRDGAAVGAVASCESAARDARDTGRSGPRPRWADVVGTARRRRHGGSSKSDNWPPMWLTLSQPMPANQQTLRHPHVKHGPTLYTFIERRDGDCVPEVFLWSFMAEPPGRETESVGGCGYPPIDTRCLAVLAWHSFLPLGRFFWFRFAARDSALQSMQPGTPPRPSTPSTVNVPHHPSLCATSVPRAPRKQCRQP